ncbi:MAG TPA: sigma-54 dependent transcriptional regulator [Candidatus Krumholzibacteria bacterium]|nr:sigma-54 dependent transcriptional regulator [Candidatus Krumholzibacteria bacterium]
MARKKVLICDDQETIRKSLGEALADDGYEIDEAGDGTTALDRVRDEAPDLLLLDLKLPDTTGVEVLRTIRDEGRDVPVILMTAYGDTPTAVEAMKLGAYDFVQKPYTLGDMKTKVASALKARLRQRSADLARAHEHETGGMYLEMLRRTPGLSEVSEIVEKLGRSRAGNEAEVLILGESGTGKEIVARAIHEVSHPGAPFMEINCAAVPESLLESELFGHEKGAFTDAKSAKEGLFELAGQGTIFLDEIGELGVTLQSRLLRVVENRKLRRVGGKEDRPVRARIVAATNRQIESAIQDGMFRNDLAQRLSVIRLNLPALRDRPEDVPTLVRVFVESFNRELGLECEPPSDELCELLVRYPWPGNVRELRNMIRRIMILEEPERVLPHHLPPHVVRGENPRAGDDQDVERIGRELLPLSEVQRIHILHVLKATKNNKSKAARILQISRQTLREKLKSFEDAEAASDDGEDLSMSAAD